jgi:hypothetical protein
VLFGAPSKSLLCLTIAGWLFAACQNAFTEEVAAIGGHGGSSQAATGGAGGTKPQPSCDDTKISREPVRRLTRIEYANTLRDLLGETSAVSEMLPPEEIVLGFDNNATLRGVTDVLVEQYMLAAETVAGRAIKDLPKLTGCDVKDIGQPSCRDRFLASFLPRAFRHSVSPATTSSFQTTFAAGVTEGGFAAGVQWVVERALQEPDFLYRTEPATAIDGWARANRLSYFLWQTMPDKQLFAKAEQGQLETADDVAKEAQRMLDDPRADNMVRRFHFQWFELDAVNHIAKDTKLFPLWKPDMPAKFISELESFAAEVVLGANGGVSELLTSSSTVLSPGLAAVYGMSGKPLGAKTMLDQTQRAGVLTRPAFLARAAKANQGSPILRGQFVREKFLCDTPPPPPENANFEVAEPAPGTSARQRFAEHNSNQSCAACHRLMDPIGFGFEHYDAIGVWRDQDGGKAVDATGEVVDNAIGKFDGAIALSKALAKSPQVASCVAKQWFRFAFGKEEQDVDACTITNVEKTLQNGGSIKSLIVAMTTTPRFIGTKKAP